MANVKLTDLHKSFGPVQVVKGVNLNVEDGELVVFVGPSGCGKSTLLRMIAGLEDVDTGSIEIAGRDVTDLPPAARGLAMVFQSYALYPHMSAYDNIAYGLRRAGFSKNEVHQRVMDVAQLLQIEQLLPRRPKAMSGGQRQRIAIGRAIVRKPSAFLFDEPLSNLDATLRVEMRAQIARLHKELKATMIFVTHDQVEAMTLADRIVVLQGGVVQQVGSPREVYHRPSNLFVAGFIGSPAMNLIDASVTSQTAKETRIEINNNSRAMKASFRKVATPNKATLGIRPDHVHLVKKKESLFAGRINLAEHLGDETILHVLSNHGKLISVKLSGDAELRIGDQVELDFDFSKACLFGPDGVNLAT